MAFNFDEQINRRESGSYKWDILDSDDIIPMWVADMDFRVAPAITDALQRRVNHGVFGYTKVGDAYYNAIISWFHRRHSWDINKNWILYTSGVVPAISVVIKALCAQGDKVIVQTPVYNCFFSSIRNNGCEIVENPLKYHDGKYTIDYDDLEKKVSDSKVKILLLCNPHNPAGRVWTKDELTRLNDICMSNGVMILSDEIHCELTYDGHQYIPFASISEDCLNNSIVCNSPSKSFNTAGLQIANIISPSEDIRNKIDRAININEVCDVNPFGVEALIAAYNEGEQWLGELCQYLKTNYDILCQMFADKMPQLTILPLEGTYLVWVDCRSLNMTSDEITDAILKDGKVMVNSGVMYGDAGEGFIRINIACPRDRMIEGVNRILRVLSAK